MWIGALGYVLALCALAWVLRHQEVPLLPAAAALGLLALVLAAATGLLPWKRVLALLPGRTGT